MRYSLVLQLLAHGIDDFDRLIEVEEALAKYLRGLAHVDGHDFGSGEMNIFLATDEPQEAFARAKVIVRAAGMLFALSAAYRLTTGSEYFRLWPVGSSEPFSMA